MDGDIFGSADSADNVFAAQIRVGLLINRYAILRSSGIDRSRSGSLNLVEGVHACALVAAAAVIAVVAGDIVVGDHGDVVHADPALLHTAPLGGADELDLQDSHFRAVEDLSNDGVGNARAAADVDAAVGVGDDTSPGAVGLLRAVAAAGSRCVGIHNAHLNLQVLAVDPAVGLLVVVNVKVDHVPAVLLFQNGHLGTAVDAAQNLTVQSAGHTDTDGIRIHNGAGADGCLGASANGDLGGALGIIGSQIDPAVVVSAFFCRLVVLIINALDFTPDFLAEQLDLVDFHFHALGELEYELLIAASFLSDVQRVADNSKLNGVDLDTSLCTRRGVTDKHAVVHNKPAGLGCLLDLAVLGFFLNRPVRLAPGLSAVCRTICQVGDSNRRAFRQLITGQITIPAGLRIELGFAANDFASECVIQHTRVGNVLIGKHLYGGVGQADPAGGGTAPTVAVDGANLKNIHRVVLCKSADDLVIHTGIAADVQIAVVSNGSRGNGSGVVGVAGRGTVIDGAPVGVHQGDPAHGHAVLLHLAPGLGFVGSNDLQLRTGSVDTGLGAGSAVAGTSVDVGVGDCDSDIELTAGVIAAVILGSAKQNPLVSLQSAPSIAVVIKEIPVYRDFGYLFAVDLLDRLSVLLAGNIVDVQSSQLRHLQCFVDVMYILASSIDFFRRQGSLLPSSPQFLAIAACRQRRNPHAAFSFRVPADKLKPGAGGRRNMSRGLSRVKNHAVCARTTLRESTNVRIVRNSAKTAGHNIGIDSVLVHIDFDLSAAEIIVVACPVAHGLQQIVGTGIADDGILDNAAAGHPCSAHVEGEHNQSVMLALGQGQLVGRSKGVDLLIQTQDHFAQSLVSLCLSDGVLVFIPTSVGDRSVGICYFMLFGTNRAVTGTELTGTRYPFTRTLEFSQLLHDRNRGLTGLQRSGRRGQSGDRHQTDQHDQS